MAKVASHTRTSHSVQAVTQAAQNNANQLNAVLAHQKGQAFSSSDTAVHSELFQTIHSDLTDLQKTKGNTLQMLQIGAKLHSLKSLTPHGEWLTILKKLGMSDSIAQKNINCSQRLAHPVFHSFKPSALHELLILTDAELSILTEGHNLKLAGTETNIKALCEMPVRTLREFLNKYLRNSPPEILTPVVSVSVAAINNGLSDEEENGIYQAYHMAKLLADITLTKTGIHTEITSESFSVVMSIIHEKLRIKGICF
jgi:hypothetical protein